MTTYTAAMGHVDHLFLMTMAETFLLALIGWIVSQDIFHFFKSPCGTSPSSTGDTEVTDFLGTTFHQYRTFKKEASDRVNRNKDGRRVQDDEDFEFNQEVYVLSTSFSKLSINDSISSDSRSRSTSNRGSNRNSSNSNKGSNRNNSNINSYRHFDRNNVRDNVDTNIDALVNKFSSLTYADVEFPLESIVIDYSCVPDVRKQSARRNIRRMLRERKQKRRQDIEREEHERQVRAGEIERQRLIKMKNDWNRRDAEMIKTKSGQILLQYRNMRKYKRNNSLRVTLLKSNSEEPWLKRRLSSFD